MKYFVALSFQNRKTLQPYTDQIKKLAQVHGDECVIFVEKQQISMTKKELMQAALSELSNADILIAEGSTKEVGVGIEMGFAHALGIPITLVRRKGAENSTTMEGISQDEPIEYSTESDLYESLNTKITTLHVATSAEQRVKDRAVKLLFEEAWLNARSLFDEYQRKHNKPFSAEEELYFTYHLASECLQEKEFQEKDLLHVYQRQSEELASQNATKRLYLVMDAQGQFNDRLKDYESKTKIPNDRQHDMQVDVFRFMWSERKEAILNKETEATRPSPLPRK